MKDTLKPEPLKGCVEDKLIPQKLRLVLPALIDDVLHKNSLYHQTTDPDFSPIPIHRDQQGPPSHEAMAGQAKGK